MVDAGEEGSGGVVLWSGAVICGLPFRETRCAGRLLKHISACGLEMGLN